MNARGKPLATGGALAASAALVFLALIAPVPSVVRLAVLVGVAAWWAVIAGRRAVRRYGRRAVVPIAVVPLALMCLAGWASWQDAPNRRTRTQIEELPGISAATDGEFLVGKVYQVYIGPGATDAGIRQFAELDGLDGLRFLIVDRAPISEVTARRLGRLKSLHSLTFQGIRVSDELLDELERELPNCQIEVMDEP